MASVSPAAASAELVDDEPKMETHNVVTLLSNGRATLKQTITLPSAAISTIQVVPIAACVDAQSIYLKDTTTNRFISTQLEELLFGIVQKDGVKYEGYVSASAGTLSNAASATSLTLFQADGQRVLIREPDVIDIPRQEFRVLFCPTPIESAASAPQDAEGGTSRQFQLTAKLSNVRWSAKGILDIHTAEEDNSTSARVSLSAVISDVNRNNVHADELYLSCESPVDTDQMQTETRRVTREALVLLSDRSERLDTISAFGGSPKVAKSLQQQQVALRKKQITAARVYGPVRDVTASHGLSLDIRTIDQVRVRRYNFLQIGEQDSNPSVRYDFLVPAEDSLPIGTYQIVEQGEIVASRSIQKTHEPHRVEATLYPKGKVLEKQITILAETSGIGKLNDDEWAGKPTAADEQAAPVPQAFTVQCADCQEVAVTGKRAYLYKQTHRRTLISDQHYTMLSDVDLTFTNQQQQRAGASCVRLQMRMCSELEEYKIQFEPADVPMRAWVVAEPSSKHVEKLDMWTVHWELWVAAGQSVKMTGSMCSVKV
eukprot:TRINITY_DN7426_c0_g1_i1.p1 TRINITY_DN7426_c0_g1~~TRINITY_DN7426_c0_g1_i1.p1  ORF type:complete len:543 (+),score=127.59 TRINITY_DN7426_c0_g1_i1:25-1653(+)